MFPGKGRHGWAPALPRLGKTRSEEADEKLERREGRSPGVLSKPVVREHVQPTGISGISRWGNAVFLLGFVGRVCAATGPRAPGLHCAAGTRCKWGSTQSRELGISSASPV